MSSSHPGCKAARSLKFRIVFQHLHQIGLSSFHLHSNQNISIFGLNFGSELQNCLLKTNFKLELNEFRQSLGKILENKFNHWSGLSSFLSWRYIFCQQPFPSRYFRRPCSDWHVRVPSFDCQQDARLCLLQQLLSLWCRLLRYGKAFFTCMIFLPILISRSDFLSNIITRMQFRITSWVFLKQR